MPTPPDFQVFIVQQTNEKEAGTDVKAKWTEVAVAFSHRDGKGLDILIPPGMSLSGRLVVRKREPKPAPR